MNYRLTSALLFLGISLTGCVGSALADPLPTNGPDRRCPPNCTAQPPSAEAVAEPFTTTIEVDGDIALDQVHDVVLWTMVTTRPNLIQGPPPDPFVVSIGRADEHQGAIAHILNNSDAPFILSAADAASSINGQTEQLVPGRTGGFFVSRITKDNQWRWSLILFPAVSGMTP